ncbi:hypothetical protein GCM10010358_83170 [Streptomyces minutiscleroticus]|uniref:Chaplin domain-containing protein n=1 Tax=Streptomyces minutiscleroticus TaxID=68238 RepID=A0A918UB21_9ACTN|nr:hypothetical protein GCM10010358_83170 [Streptomyces minutiscleroticus]
MTMSSHRLSRAAIIAVSMMATIQTSLAWAGGIGGALSPVFAQNCANHHTDDYANPAAYGSPTHVLQLPLLMPYNQCGDAVTPLGYTDGGLG